MGCSSFILKNNKIITIRSSILENIKSKYILKKIFDLLQENKLLGIIRYNKKIQKRINLSIKYYKEYSEIYTPIEIELIPFKNNFGEFINNKGKERYYHIYCDDNKEEAKRNYLRRDDKVSKIKIIIDYQIKSFNCLFYSCKCLESIRFIKFYRNNIINMRGMFNSCSSLKNIKFSNFNTYNVTNMSEMFRYCSSLQNLDLSNFNTHNVIDMSDMFSNCSSLQKLNLSNFNTNNTINTSRMFF